MRLLSLRPERSASANSATSAFFRWRVVFYLKRLFCQQVMDGKGRAASFVVQDSYIHLQGKFSRREQMLCHRRYDQILCKVVVSIITVLLGNISFYSQNCYSVHQERSCHVCSSRSDLTSIARPRWFRCVCIPIQSRRTQQHGSSGKMRDLPLP
jgi:hypothetical protein